MMKYWSWVAVGLSIVTISVLAGCGGSKAPVRTNNASLLSSSGYGKVTLTVHWPERGRVIPYATEQIVARLKRNGSILFEQVIERGQTQVVFEKVPVGNWVLEAEARGTGTQAVEVKGEVIDYDTNSPVPNAQVTLMIFSPQEKTLSTTTDNSGQFNFGLVSFHFGEIKVTAQGYQEFYWPVNFGDFVTGEGITIHMLKPSSGGAPPPPPSRSKRQWSNIILASGAASFTLGANENKQVVVELASKLKDLNVTPAQIRLAIGESVDVAVQGLIEQANEWDPNRVWLYLVELNPNKVRWQVADSSVISLSATTGLSVTLRGLREGQTTLTVRDEESGKSKQVSVQVASARVVTIRLQTINGQPVNAEWAAFQDGDGNWQVVNPTSQGVYRLQVTDPAGRYGFAYVYHAWGEEGIFLLQATTGEASKVTLGYFEPEKRFTVNGKLSGERNYGAIVAIFDDEDYVPLNESSFELEVPGGIWDIVAYEQKSESDTDYATRIYIHRGLEVKGNMEYDINLNDVSKTQTLTTKYTLNIQGNPEPETAYVEFISANNTCAELAWGRKQQALQYPIVPSELSKNGDLYMAYAGNYDGEVIRIFSKPHDLTISLPSPLTEVNISDRTLSNLKYERASWWEVYGYRWIIRITSGWLGNSTNYTIPDFSNLSGWNSEWKWSHGYEVSAVICNKTLSELAQARWYSSWDEWLVLDGLELKLARQQLGRGRIAPESGKKSRKRLLFGSVGIPVEGKPLMRQIRGLISR